ncbi:uncharacterized protein RMCFA_2689 [Mycolicibacterium fortuitum subsp. acetamidolyticum]|uniref:Lipoprotein n=1 Tax=Mycolicibacterium fortuitum subsp. acetamidolyticum TaxID=144550 RepID=A0A100WQI0_MYCFO|nr:uncharacterized protein RMCFA_2689 [Mycolicibacterium fortuitum subsp. acetamidolyticum]
MCRHAATVLLVGLIPLAAACGNTPAPAPEPWTTETTTPAIKLQKADDPIEELTGRGSHCFETGVEAVAARMRAAEVIQADNAQKQRALDTKGELMPAGYPYTVTDVERKPNGTTCYIVQSSALL